MNRPTNTTSPVSSSQPSEGASPVGGGGLLCSPRVCFALHQLRLPCRGLAWPVVAGALLANQGAPPRRIVSGGGAKSSATAPPNHNALRRAVVRTPPAGVRRSGHLAAATQQAVTSTGPQAAISPRDLIVALWIQHGSRKAGG